MDSSQQAGVGEYCRLLRGEMSGVSEVGSLELEVHPSLSWPIPRGWAVALHLFAGPPCCPTHPGLLCWAPQAQPPSPTVSWWFSHGPRKRLLVNFK